MSAKKINLFMWGYQTHFRVDVQSRMNRVMKEMGVITAGAECMLVGVRVTDNENPNEVCVEPEDWKWPLKLFEGLYADVDSEVASHPLQNIFYGDEPSMQDKPENIRKDSVRRAVEKALAPYDEEQGMRSFAGAPASVGGYHVTPVLQVPIDIFERFRPLREPITDGRCIGHPSFIHAAIDQVLSEAHDELLRPDPGRLLSDRSRSTEEITRRAAAKFMHTPGLAIGGQGYEGHDLFERFNLISSLMYERTEGTGRVILSNLENEAVDIVLQLAEAVPFREPRWSRKLLQMASRETALIANFGEFLGLGTVVSGADPWTTQDLFEVEFLDHYHWRLSCGDEVLLVSKYGVPSLPQERFPRARLVDTFRRLFPESSEENVDEVMEIFDAAVNQRHGSMFIVAQDAKAEAERLRGQGTKIEATKLTPLLYRRVSDIDGTIIIDPHCVCHAIGVILDGPSRPECTPSRGSRYNSGIRYIGASESNRLAIIISDDGTVDVIPILRPQIKRSRVEEAIVALEASSRENLHPSINWLDNHRFYLDGCQCDRINAALARIKEEPMSVGEIWVLRTEFTPHPSLNDSYFEFEEGEKGGTST